jgi:hypothetical protein
MTIDDAFRIYMNCFNFPNVRGSGEEVLLHEDSQGNDYVIFEVGKEQEFLDRLERSKACGKNLFLKECEKIPYRPLPKEIIPD